jgi:type IV secretion system protein VirB9
MRSIALLFMFMFMGGKVSAAPLTEQALSIDRSAQRDPRIRVVDYDPNKIVKLVAHTGYQVSVEFGENERIETVGLGDASVWQITPNSAANVLFVKPTGVSRPTNMYIVTSKRRYSLELLPRSGRHVAAKNVLYALRFRYPLEPVAEVMSLAPPAPLIVTPQEQWNRAYSYDGAVANVPEEMFDDGAATYFRFAPGTATPAIFIVAAGSGESVVNFAVRGPYVVIDSLAPQFVLRQGNAVTRIYNDTYKLPTPGPNAPTARATTTKKKKGFFGLFRKDDQ